MSRSLFRARRGRTTRRAAVETSSPSRNRRVVVAHTEAVSDRAILLDLRAPESTETLTPFTPGAHVDIHVSDTMVRQYSLVGSDEDTGRLIGLPGAVSEVLDLEILQPLVGDLVEGTVGPKYAGRSEGRASEQATLEPRGGEVGGASADAPGAAGRRRRVPGSRRASHRALGGGL